MRDFVVVLMAALITGFITVALAAEPTAPSSDQDLLIRMDQRQQQLGHEVQSLKGDLLRALDQQQKALEAGQQSVRTQLESLDKRREGKCCDLDKRGDTNFAQIEKRLDTQSTLLWSLLGLIIVLVPGGFGLLWRMIDKLSDRLPPLIERLEALEKQYVLLSERLAAMDSRLTPLSTQLAAMDNRLSPLLERLAAVETRLTVFDNRLSALDTRLDTRLTTIAERLISMGSSFDPPASPLQSPD